MKNRFRFCATWWLDKLLFLQRCVWQYYNERFRLTDASVVTEPRYRSEYSIFSAKMIQIQRESAKKWDNSKKLNGILKTIYKYMRKLILQSSDFHPFSGT